jgi:hypothetical protein
VKRPRLHPGETTSAAGAAATAVAAAAPVLPLLSGDELDAAVSSFAATLGEADARAIEEMRAVIASQGLARARAAMAKTAEIEASGGIVRDGRRKTPGGVFFFLTKTRAGDALLGPEFARAQPRPAPAAPVAPVAPATAPAPRAPSRSAGPERGSVDLVDAMLMFIAKNPGLREDEIRARLAGDRMLIQATLNALRTNRRVKTIGSGRAMVYTVAG